MGGVLLYYILWRSLWFVVFHSCSENILKGYCWLLLGLRLPGMQQCIMNFLPCLMKECLEMAIPVGMTMHWLFDNKCFRSWFRKKNLRLLGIVHYLHDTEFEGWGCRFFLLPEGYAAMSSFAWARGVGNVIHSLAAKILPPPHVE